MFRDSLTVNGNCVASELLVERLEANLKNNLVAFFGAFFDEAFGEEDEAAHLDPFGDDIADDLAPFALGIHFPKQHGPADAGEDEEDQEGVSPDEFQKTVFGHDFHGAAFGGVELDEVFGAEDDDDGAAPISDGIAEK